MSSLRFAMLVGALGLVAGCPQEPASKLCPGTGILCPEDMYCAAVQPVCLTTACGNGLIDPGEECDDGNVLAQDTCSPICRREACGNSMVDPGEVCDDGNTTAGDGCSPNCMSREICGNSIVDQGEACDDGNATNADGCSGTSVSVGSETSPEPCRSTEVCGNGLKDIQTGEACDDGNTVSGDGCNMDCRSGEGCGNGIVDPGEQCDDGNANNNDDCLDICKTAKCGDGVVDNMGTRNETCDPSTNGNPLETTTCNIDCTTRVCGDGKVNQSAGEQCDNGVGNNGDMRNCTAVCALNVCGDGKVDQQAPGLEQCDDGNTNNTDGCSNACALASCGNATVDAGEMCDDGNMVNTDACVMCSNAVCGDGSVRAGVELCDDGNLNNGDGCSSSCRTEGCGNGTLDPGEQCDDGNAVNTDACVGSCRSAVCGDNFIRTTVEFCDDGNLVNGDGCSNSCRFEGCGNGALDPGEACDDGNTANGDGCSSMCRFEGCGDGLINNGEPCDGNGMGTGGETATCNADCTVRACGDAKVNAVAGEQCDSGTIMGVNQNANNRDCTAMCRINICTDGHRNTVGPMRMEACDDGNTIATDGCNNNCQLASCGNGLVDPNEQCDDSNINNADSCVNCMNAQCGDGFIELGVEECDNLTGPQPCSPPSGPIPSCRQIRCGNGILDGGDECDDDIVPIGMSLDASHNDDGCSSACVIEFCGDGTRQPGSESCDPGAIGVDTTMCNRDCTSNTCGDGITNLNTEQCDDGDTVSGDGCNSNCDHENCGNGVRENQEECDGTDGAGPQGCDAATCLDKECGNGRIDPGEGCDDDNTTTEECAYGAEGCTVCSSTCQPVAGATNFCGDSLIDGPGGNGFTGGPETCDAGTGATGNGMPCAYGQQTCSRCNSSCTGMVTFAGQFCGNGATMGGTPAETCDDGNTVTEPDTSCPYGTAAVHPCTICNASCQATPSSGGRYCGDDTIDGNNGETCDDGAMNTNTPTCDYGDFVCTYCNSSCQVAMTTSDYCGDDTQDSGFEACDGADLDGKTCATQVPSSTSGTLSCNTDCTFNTDACVVPTCGDGVKNQGAGVEDCDGSDFGGATCASATSPATPAGSLSCDSSCNLVTTSCTAPPPSCGDNVKNGAPGAEECDRTDFGTATCASETGGTKPLGTLTCNGGCNIVTNDCEALPPPTMTCGNGTREGSEQCDYGPDPTGADNNSVKCMPGGSGPAYGMSCLACNSSCAAVISSGGFCGDNVKNGPEQCDNTSFGSSTCADLGAFTMGMPGCSAGCTLTMGTCAP